MPIIPRLVTRRVALTLAGALLLPGGAAVGAFFYDLHRENGALQALPLPRLPGPTAGESVLVFAPHCDDETLGAGGFIREAVRAGARVRVIFLTNGDGFPLAVSKQYLKLRPSRNSYLRFAYHRQTETIAALAELGVPPEQVTFLGYPDGGLAPMWNRFWRPDTLYRSRFTGCTRVPYRNAFRSGAPYCGSAVLADLQALLRRERPTQIVVPHPGDDHPDHWATYCYVLAALRAIRLQGATGPEPGWGADPRVQTYLVHRGDWPVPQGLRPEARLVPPAALMGLDTRWAAFPLAPADREAKQRALLRYRSQMAVMRRFLESFVRNDELFGTMPPATIALTSDSGNLTSHPLLPGEQLSPVILDSAEDTLMRDLNGGADLVAMAAATDGQSLLVRLTTRARLSPRVRYRLRLHPLGHGPDEVGEPITLTFQRGRCDRDDIRCDYRGKDLQAVVPLSALGYPRELILGADTELARVVVDHVCWRDLRLPLLSSPLIVSRAGPHWAAERPERSARHASSNGEPHFPIAAPAGLIGPLAPATLPLPQR
jgi:LmbE family N-acetylglucosaminyl deacetylase